jgi:hypothetical protein
MTTTEYKDFPFTAGGVNYISRLYSHSPFLPVVERMPAGMFDSMNINAVNEMLTLGKTFTLLEIEAELKRVNENATHAFLLLGDN